jgi:hypothetical protein
MRAGLRTRNRAERPTEVPVVVDGVQMLVAEAGAIAGFPIVRFNTSPGALTLPPVENEWPGVELEVRTSAPLEPELWRRLPQGQISFAPVAFDLTAFARLCTKIAHGYAVATFGLDAFDAWLPPYILGVNKQFGYVLGSSHEQPRDDHVANALNWSAYEMTNTTLLAVHIHLFPPMGQPPIAVVVGSMSSDQYDALRRMTHHSGVA